MESSRRGLLNDMAEHRSILKNDQNTYYSVFSFAPKTGKNYHKVIRSNHVRIGSAYGSMRLTPLEWRPKAKRKSYKMQRFKTASVAGAI